MFVQAKLDVLVYTKRQLVVAAAANSFRANVARCGALCIRLYEFYIYDATSSARLRAHCI